MHALCRRLSLGITVRTRRGGALISTLTGDAIVAMAATVSITEFSVLRGAVSLLSAIYPALLAEHWLGSGSC